MKRATKRASMIAMFVVVALAAMLIVGVATAFAGAPDVVGGDSSTGYFLCPAIGGPNWAERTGQDGLPGGQGTFLPGHNQAGLHVNVNGTNGDGAPGASPGPGNVVDGHGNTEWSPIWNVNIQPE